MDAWHATFIGMKSLVILICLFASTPNLVFSQISSASERCHNRALKRKGGEKCNTYEFQQAPLHHRQSRCTRNPHDLSNFACRNLKTETENCIYRELERAGVHFWRQQKADFIRFMKTDFFDTDQNTRMLAFGIWTFLRSNLRAFNKRQDISQKELFSRTTSLTLLCPTQGVTAAPTRAFILVIRFVLSRLMWTFLLFRPETKALW